MKKLVSTCGFSALISGCIPGHLQTLTEEEEAAIGEVLEESDMHINFLRRAAEITQDDMIIFSGKTEDGGALEQEWTAVVDRGYELLDSERILIIEDEKMDKQYEHLEAYAHYGLAENKEFVVIRRETMDEVLKKDTGTFSGTLMHEIAHIADPQERAHDKEFEEVIIAGADGKTILDLARVYEDTPYFLYPFFSYGMLGIQGEKERDHEEGIEGEENILEKIETGDISPLIAIRELEMQKKLLVEDGSAWVEESGAWYLHEKTPTTPQEEVAYEMGEAFTRMRLFHFLSLQKILDVDDKKMIELFASQEGGFLRELYQEALDHTLERVNELYPEARREYIQEISRAEQREREASMQARRDSAERNIPYPRLR